MYGLRSAPKTWSETRDEELRNATIKMGDEEATFQQSNGAKGIWEIVKGNGEIV